MHRQTTNQHLVDICFAVANRVWEYHSDFKNNEELMEYVAEQLRLCGFDTSPCGSSWGVLKDA